MTAPPLTIRNLTSAPVELKLIERYAAPNSSPALKPVKGVFGLAQNATNFIANATALAGPNPTSGPSAPKLKENAESFASQDVNVRVEPFTAVNTDIKATERKPGEILRLTFESDGQRYRIDTPSPKHDSQELTPLVPDPRHRYTGVFLPQQTYLSLYSSANLQNWMRELRDDTPLACLSIAGTHNSPTCHNALPSVRCQAVSPRKQLENGVRFFDIRVQPQTPQDPSKDGLILVHGVFPISLTGNKYFRDLANETLRFLDENPSETVIISVKREGPGQHTDQQLSMILHDHYTQDGSRWWTDPRIPNLGEARRKIVLMRRFCLDDRIRGDHDGRGYALDAENWAYNTPNDTHGSVCVQDFCEVLETENIDKKIQFSTEHLHRAGCCKGAGPLYLNFLSASNFWKVGCWPEKIAAKLNPNVIQYLCQKHHEGEGDGCTGIVVCDWVGYEGDWDLVRCIVGMNSRLLLKQQ